MVYFWLQFINVYLKEAGNLFIFCFYNSIEFGRYLNLRYEVYL